MEEELLRNLLVFLSLLPILSFAPNSSGQTYSDRLATPHGALEVRDARGPICGDMGTCKIVQLSGKVLLRDWTATIDFAYPSQGGPRLVGLTMSTGGNACCWQSYFLDLSGTVPLLVKQPGSFGVKLVTQAEGGVLFDSDTGDDALGDRLITVFKYTWGSGTPIALKTGPKYSQTPLRQKQYPEDVLSDLTLRPPIMATVGRSNFKKFRQTMMVSHGISLIESRFLIGSGCMPHFCCGSSSIFVLDLLKNAAWAIESANPTCQPGTGTARMWGTLEQDDVTPTQYLSQWLASVHIPWSRVSRDRAQLSPADAAAQLASPPKWPKAEIALKVEIPVQELRSITLSPDVLFETLAPAIYVVEATRLDGALSQGSAVAVSPHYLLTNCHVVSGARVLSMTQKGKRLGVELAAANVPSDSCVLRSGVRLPSYVPVRKYGSIRVGERAYSIGAPLGLELTLSDGLISGKRSHEGVRFIQTTAPISPGSSGGGLFDANGNLVGITTFVLKGSQNLNFAIAAEDFSTK